MQLIGLFCFCLPGPGNMAPGPAPGHGEALQWGQDPEKSDQMSHCCSLSSQKSHRVGS